MINKLPLQSTDITAENIQIVAKHFPQCITETANGKAIDFDALKQELSPNIIDGLKERYRLEWPGKRESIVTANIPTTKTLRPIVVDSVNFDTTENLYIEGDNLEVLKLLQESYLGKIKMIEIDPPYNTGSDFVYKDNFTINAEDYKTDNEKDEYGQRMFVNPDSSGRYHSDWLSMIYPRLKLARNLLTDDGVIFIHIDDNEVHNLRKVCDEVFGEGNFVGCFCWRKKAGAGADSKFFFRQHENILLFAKNINNINALFQPLTEKQKLEYKNPDNDFRGNWAPTDLKRAGDNDPRRIYKVYSPNGSEFESCWSYTQENFKKLEEENLIWWGKTNSNEPKRKRFLNDKEGLTPRSWIDIFLTSDGTKDMKSIEFDSIFDYPKPVGLLQLFIQIGSKPNDIILDFFSGSATTAHAVMQLNAEDGGNRKFIMVQVPEQTDEKSEAYKAGYKNICEIGKERIRRAGKKIQEEQLAAGKQQLVNQSKELAFEEPTNQATNQLDIGFRVYRLDSSNMQDVYYKPQDFKKENLDLFASNIKPDRTSEDLLAQVMLSWGLPLHYKIATLTIQNKQVFKIEENSLFACFDNGIDEAFAKEIATYQPLRIVFKDDSFKDDTAKENVKQLLKQLSANTEMKVI